MHVLPSTGEATDQALGNPCVGLAFILLGIAALFLPVLQGILFLVIGLLILSTEYVWAHNLLYKTYSSLSSRCRTHGSCEDES
jgi:uncharacterized protein